MRMISWNVNGLRAALGKGFMDAFAALDADVFCLQETKLQPGQLEMALPGYHQYWNYAERKGYSARLSLPVGNPSPCAMASGWRSTTTRAASSPWTWGISTW